MDYLDTLLKYSHITKKDIDTYHHWLRTDPIKKADPERKAQTRGEVMTMMLCFTGRLTVPDTFDENQKVTADDLLKEILAGTENDEKSAFFLFETLTRAKLIMLTPEPAPGADFETETTYVYLNADYVEDVRKCRERAFLADHPQTH